MPLKPRTLITVLSALYLLTLTTLAAYALHKSHSLSLPVPNILAALAIALPPLAGVAIETSTSLLASATNRSSLAKPNPRLSPARATLVLHSTFAFLLVYETVLATLAGTHLRPSVCALRDKWQGMFHAKDAAGIRAVQEALKCCGFQSGKDMAWPFPGQGRDANACEARFGGAAPRCSEGWEGQERVVGGLLVGVAIGVFVWQLLVVAIPAPSGSRSWLPAGVQLPADGERRRLEYRDAEDVGEDDSLADEVRRLNSDSQLATTVEGTRERNGVLLPRENQWSLTSDAA